MEWILIMNFYDIFMYPLERIHLHPMRKKLIPNAKDTVLEIGAGTGVNFKYYEAEKIESIVVLDKEENKEAKKSMLNNMEFIIADAANLPFEDNSFDTVVETLLLCSVDKEEEVLSEIYRVLKPNGLFIHIDHGLPENNVSKKVFNTLAPLWHSITRSCRINKEYKSLLKKDGFVTIDEVKRGGGVLYGGISRKC